MLSRAIARLLSLLVKLVLLSGLLVAAPEQHAVVVKVVALTVLLVTLQLNTPKGVSQYVGSIE